MPLARTVTGRDGLLNGIAASVTAGAAATLTAVGSRLRIQQTPPPPPPWRLVPAAARSLVSDARHHLPSSAVGILFGAAVGTAAGAVLLLSQMERRMRKVTRPPATAPPTPLPAQGVDLSSALSTDVAAPANPPLRPGGGACRRGQRDGCAAAVFPHAARGAGSAAPPVG